MTDFLADFVQTVFLAPDEWFAEFIYGYQTSFMGQNLFALAIVLLGLGVVTAILMVRVAANGWPQMLVNVGIASTLLYIAYSAPGGGYVIPFSTPTDFSTQNKYYQANTPLAKFMVGDLDDDGIYKRLTQWNHAQLERTFEEIDKKLAGVNQYNKELYKALDEMPQPNVADNVRYAGISYMAIEAAKSGIGKNEDLINAVGSEEFARSTYNEYNRAQELVLDKVNNALGDLNQFVTMLLLIPGAYMASTLMFGMVLHVAVIVFPIIAALVAFGRFGYILLSNWLAVVISAIASLLFIGPTMRFAMDLGTYRPLENINTYLINLTKSTLNSPKDYLFLHASSLDASLGGVGIYPFYALFLVLLSVGMAFFTFRIVARLFGGLAVGNIDYPNLMRYLPKVRAASAAKNTATASKNAATASASAGSGSTRTSRQRPSSNNSNPTPAAPASASGSGSASGGGGGSGGDGSAGRSRPRTPRP